MPNCPTCLDTKTVDLDIGRPLWPATEITPETPSHVVRNIECPDCVPCDQCAHPDHDGDHSCRLLGGRFLPKTL